MSRLAYFIAFVAVFCTPFIGFLGCGPKSTCPSPGETRCTDNRVQLCSPSSRWTEHSDCAVVEPGTWVCRQLPEGDHTCLPTSVPDAEPTSESTSTPNPK